MPDILSAVENTERQPGQEIPRGKIASNGSNLEAGFPLEKHIDILELREIVLSIATVLYQLRPIFHILRHGMLKIQFVQLTKHCAPEKQNDTVDKMRNR